MRQIATETARPASGRIRREPVLLWASLIPLMFTLRAYGGLAQDARIYIGRGLADLDPGGLGRDFLFAGDGQTGFSLFRMMVRGSLALLPADRLSALLVAVGLVGWLAGASVLAARLAGGRAVWAVVVGVLALPAQYGSFGTFHYGEAIATPRLYAEALVLGGVAELLARRRFNGLGLLGLALAFHPLMALPGLALAMLLLVLEDRRWLVALGVLLASALVAAFAKAPLLDRLFLQMDPVWFGILYNRSSNLFPTLWPAETSWLIGYRVAAALVAATLLPKPGRDLMVGVVAIGLGGLGLSLLLGDLMPSVLVMQLQPWRALWLLAVLGNAGMILSAISLWKAGPAARLTLGLLIMALAAEAVPSFAAFLAAAALAVRIGELNGRFKGLTPRIGQVALVAAAALAACGTVLSAGNLRELFSSLGAAWPYEAPWVYVLSSHVVMMPVFAGAVAFVLAPATWLRHRSARLAALTAFGISILAAAVLWDSRTGEQRTTDGREGAPELERAMGSEAGPVLWVDDLGESWLLARRPALFNTVQGGPILFSRALALEWADRASRLRALGLIHATDISPLANRGADLPDIVLTPGAVTAFCADVLHPAALVAPGDQRAAVPLGLPATLWHAAWPFRRLSVVEGVFRWHTITIFTVVRCAPDLTLQAGAAVKVGDH